MFFVLLHMDLKVTQLEEGLVSKQGSIKSGEEEEKSRAANASVAKVSLLGDQNCFHSS